jgi:hypothetical protein
LKALSELPALEFLWLNNTQLLPQYYSDIAKLSHVKILNLSACDLDDSSLKYVGQMNQLTDLKLSRNTRLSNASLKSLRGLTHLKFLNLDTPKVTLKGLQDLKEMPLREIVISNFAWAKESKEIARTFPHTLVISPESKNTPDVRFLYSPLK